MIGRRQLSCPFSQISRLVHSSPAFCSHSVVFNPALLAKISGAYDMYAPVAGSRTPSMSRDRPE